MSLGPVDGNYRVDKPKLARVIIRIIVFDNFEGHR